MISGNEFVFLFASHLGSEAGRLHGAPIAQPTSHMTPAIADQYDGRIPVARPMAANVEYAHYHGQANLNTAPPSQGRQRTGRSAHVRFFRGSTMHAVILFLYSSPQSTRMHVQVTTQQRSKCRVSPTPTPTMTLCWSCCTRQSELPPRTMVKY
jgi:hypothetical protein